MNAIAQIRKALIAMAITGGTALLSALGAESPGGDAIVAAEWWSIAGLSATALGAVFLVPNQLTHAQRAKVLAEYQTSLAVRAQHRRGGHSAP